MDEINRSSNQINAGNTGGKLSRLRWLFPFFLIGTSSLIAAILLFLRISGALQIQQGYLPLITIVSLLTCITVGTLLYARQKRLLLLVKRQRVILVLSLVFPISVGMLATLPTGGSTLLSGLFLSAAYFLGFAVVQEILERECAKCLKLQLSVHEDLKQPEIEEIESVAGEADSDETPSMVAENNEALFEGLLDQSDSVVEAEKNSKEDYSQWMNRSTDTEGFEVIEGGALVQFSVNQKTSVIHVGLFPPVEGDLDVQCESNAGAAVRIRVLETRGYGISMEVNRNYDLTSEFEMYLYYRISNNLFREEVA